MNARKLSLKREALTELSNDQLSVVVGGTHVACNATEGCTHVQSVDPCEMQTTPPAYCLTLAGPRCIY